MKTIYTEISKKLKEINTIKWIDFDKGQLDTNERPQIAFPAALISIDVYECQDITETEQDCKAKISIRLAFDNQMKTEASTPSTALNKALSPYDVIADVYTKMQGFSTDYFSSISRKRQGKESNRSGIFVYTIVFNTQFEDISANL